MPYSCAADLYNVREHPAPSGALRHSTRILDITSESGQGAPSTIRCIKTWPSSCTGSPGSSVREHPAPSGALRHEGSDLFLTQCFCVREHPAPSGALRRHDSDQLLVVVVSDVREHPAPSGALRLVDPAILVSPVRTVREHPAPSGALRRRPTNRSCGYHCGVRKHPAPLGALRLDIEVCLDLIDLVVREHPAPSGALRQGVHTGHRRPELRRQGAPSTIRCIKTQSPTCRRAAS